MIDVYQDRSRVLCGQHCPREKWFQYPAPNGQPIPGVVPAHLNSDLTIGSAFHVGGEALLTGASEDEAVGRALEGHGEWRGVWPLLRDKGLIVVPGQDGTYEQQEMAALVEALIRGYARYALPQLLDRFEVVEVERDGEAVFTDAPIRLHWGYRADALLMEKETLDLYVLSFKTSKLFDKKKQSGGNTDMQGLSEVACIDQRLQEWQETYLTSINRDRLPQWFQDRAAQGAAPHCFGVKMEYALKGLKREWPEGSGVRKYDNALIRPWKFAEDLAPKRRGSASANLGSQYAVSYEFRDELGGNHRLGKGWTRINIWEDMGVKNWIDYTMEESIQGFTPGFAVERQFALPIEFYRNDRDIERWKKRMLYLAKREHTEANLCLNELAGGDVDGFEDQLDSSFPPSSNACDYPVECSYKGICYGSNRGYLINPLEIGGLEPRRPNHQAELVLIEETR